MKKIIESLQIKRSLKLIPMYLIYTLLVSAFNQMYQFRTDIKFSVWFEQKSEQYSLDTQVPDISRVSKNSTETNIISDGVSVTPDAFALVSGEYLNN